MKAVDVAERAGVSSATVSLVVNGKAEGRVSPETADRVRKVVAEMGYTVDPSARGLATGRRHCVALVASDMTNPFISTIAAGVAEGLGSDYQLLLAVSGAERAAPDISKVLAFGVDGVLLDLPVIDEVRERAPACPIVALDDSSAQSSTSKVFFGVQDATRALGEHLVELGHRHIAYLDPGRPISTFRSRREALVKRLRQINPGGTLVQAKSTIEVEGARAAIHRHWPAWRRAGVTAVVVASDVQAYGVLAAFNDLGLDVPGDVSLASFDGLPFATITRPPLTTVSLPAFDLGRRGALLLTELIGGGAGISSVELPAQLVIRESTGPAKRRGRR